MRNDSAEPRDSRARNRTTLREPADSGATRTVLTRPEEGTCRTEARMAAVYVQTNESQNKVVAFRRAPSGALAPLAVHETGGAGDEKPHLTSQGSVVLTSDGGHLLVTNVGSDDVSVFAVAADGDLELIGRTPAGGAPKSIAEHRGLVYVLATGVPGVVRVPAWPGRARAGSQAPTTPLLPTPIRPRSASRPTARRSSSPSGAPTRSAAIPVDADGMLGERQTVASSGPDPVRVRGDERRDARRHRGVPGPEGRRRRVVVLGGRTRRSRR